MIKLCQTCGTSYCETDIAIEHCKICEDERQYVPPSGQKWTDMQSLTTTHCNKWQLHQENLFSIQTVPGFAINQRAFLVITPQGNILWDCIANLDDATRALVSALGGISAIAISHPHYYTTMQDWAETFNAPVWLHASDREWIMRHSPAIKLWNGDEQRICSSVRLIRLGGHFPGGTILHWDTGDGVLLTGDIVQVTPGADAVSFMWSYPNMLPLPAAVVGDMVRRLGEIRFNQLYGAFEGKNIRDNASAIVQRSGEKYLACLK